MNFLKFCFSFTIIILSVILGFYYKYAPHLNYRLQEKVNLGVIQVIDNFFTDQDISYLKEQMEGIGLKNGQIGYESQYPYGISDPINGRCPSNYQHISQYGDKCMLYGRLDVGKHALLQGGSEAQNIRFDRLMSKINNLQSHLPIDQSQDDNLSQIFKKVLESQEYINLVEPICGFKNPYLTNVNPQVTLILPGQELPQHYDTGYLQGISATNYPSWLIVAMKNSGLFKDIDIPQIQGVTYLHSWDNKNSTQNLGGQLRAWDYGPNYEYKSFEAKQKRVILFDGGKIAHQSAAYKPDQEPIQYNKDLGYTSFHNNESKTWDIYETQSGELFTSVDDQDARLTMVWRQNCFKDYEESVEHQRKIDEEDHIKVDDSVDILLQNLKQEGKISNIPKEEIEKAKIIIDNYIEYAYDKNKWFPYNICVLAELVIPRQFLQFINFNSIC